MEKRIDGHTRLLGLIGTPVGHSGSPAMYNYSFEKLGINYAYLAFDVPVEKVGAFIDTMHTLNMRGANVTMPDKQAVMPYMDELSPAARIVGAVNTIVNDDGRLTGHMTDGEGFVRNLKEHGVDVDGKKMVVIGAGGAATAIQVQSALDGAREIAIFNIKDAFFTRAQETAQKIKAEKPDCAVQVCDLADTALLAREIATAEILVNATLSGMAPHEDTTAIPDPSVFREDLVVCDAVYNPKETRMMREAREAGVKTIVSGSGMLLWQGAAALTLYTGEQMPTDEVNALFFK